jgi:hypothetical protein
VHLTVVTGVTSTSSSTALHASRSPRFMVAERLGST